MSRASREASNCDMLESSYHACEPVHELYEFNIIAMRHVYELLEAGCLDLLSPFLNFM